ncbi:energy transducer TonB [Pseudoalteromonas carrageenovora]|jgi:protein TonB|uniref:Energy transducer TonB n=1 Tax=Pseudoalteromonas carrageenovora IAM 12662 TaxID=1314868 RepID=A0A2K4X6U1_PSEVC|nr:energy transducer TonB [Pseudoalteromonas carrageenovora]MBE0382250.1 hypothetical protein [Pseudoalteromonas carrageenovora IAM 12662]MCQ8889184.1 energy transducer TonB [Pseudoalteromonas carrageenovora]MDO6546739.1 energy transducer TonB [Pseudoalteromonas carrageenovora]MDO6830710.1 energy transducer TonB [Pseudoalteromonas carrageenovora]QBJ70971.1 energy transducer TonB [Pseudoalteromonas carrageenovora]
MKALYFIFPMTALLSACSSTTDSSEDISKLNYLDLSTPELRDTEKEYWLNKKRVEPIYPAKAAKKGITGCVELVTVINSQGKAQGYKVISSYPEGVFDQSSLKAVKLWRWKAAPQNTNKQPVLTNIRLDYSLTPKPTGEEYLKNCPARKFYY